MSAWDVTNPYNGEVLYRQEPATSSEIETAMTRAREAAAELQAMPVRERLEGIRALIGYLTENREPLLDRIVAESGRCRTDAMISDLFQLTEDLEWLCHRAPGILAPEKVPTPVTLLGKKSRILHEPHGVVLVISPWNLPLAIGLTASMFALAAGNAVILKPSEHTPMADVLEEITRLHPVLEKGLRVLQGDGDVGRQVIDLRPDHIVFTGSQKTGRAILAQAAPLLIPVTLELGSRDPMLVFADADLERAVGAACWGNLHNSGQSCTATERLLVEESVAGDFTARLLAALGSMRTGVDADAELGVPTTGFQMRHIEALVDDAREQGAEILCGGGRSECGRFFRPTVIRGVTPAMRITREEIFGPVMTLQTFSSEEEAVRLHNEAGCGLSTAVFTRDRERARRLERSLRTGCINVNNVMLTEGNVSLPFGGVGDSGFGRMKGGEGLLGMTRSRAVLEDWTRAPAEPNWHPYSSHKLAVMARLLDALISRGPARLWRLARSGLEVDALVRRRKG